MLKNHLVTQVNTHIYTLASHSGLLTILGRSPVLYLMYIFTSTIYHLPTMFNNTEYSNTEYLTQLPNFFGEVMPILPTQKLMVVKFS